MARPRIHYPRQIIHKIPGFQPDGRKSSDFVFFFIFFFVFLFVII